ncbi:hypothetical protein NECAME_03256 [Necator americanus]|uniref:Uncharacterized protein n=1 Tax=Necator americanus TaxID=51031 RepID=W2T7L3_NECAM|nr:hypothetical protein NECAME_03256 [Necator americanus]ETN77156.1 hypothetical protein NECAME_03256 [Necator americanus]
MHQYDLLNRSTQCTYMISLDRSILRFTGLVIRDERGRSNPREPMERQQPRLGSKNGSRNMGDKSRASLRVQSTCRAILSDEVGQAAVDELIAMKAKIVRLFGILFN